MRGFWKKKEAPVQVVHYAPDVSLTPVDYILPMQPEQWIRQAEARIRDFLAQTEPDSLCESFYDRFVEKEERLIICRLLEQTPEHLDAGRSIAEKHSAELKRLDQALNQADELLQDYEAEIAALQKLYDRCNGMEAEA